MRMKCLETTTILKNNMHNKVVNDSNVSTLFSGEIESLFNIFKLIIENTEKEKNISIGVVISDDFEIGASEDSDRQFAVTIGLPIFREFSLRILKNDALFLQKSLQEFDNVVPIIQNFKYYQKIIFYTSIYQLFGHEIAHIALGHCHDDWQPTSTEQLRGEEGYADQCAGFLLPNMIANIQERLQHYLPKLPANVCSNFCLYIILFSSIYSYKIMSDMFPSETENYPAWTTVVSRIFRTFCSSHVVSVLAMP